MGFFQRVFRLNNRPRQSGSGRIWDNVNSPGGTGAPAVTTNTAITTTPLQNYYSPGPNPEFYLKGAGYRDPFRLHAPYDDLLPAIPVREPTSEVGYGFANDDNSQSSSVGLPGVLQPGPYVKGLAPSQVRKRDLKFDAGNRGVLSVPTLASQTYFNQKTPLPEFTTPSVYSHSVIVPELQSQTGWEQPYVPDPGMSENHVGFSPPVQLSRPLNVRTRVESVSGQRSPIKTAKAPKRQRGG